MKKIEKTVYLKRKEFNKKETLGEMFFEDKKIAVTLEPPRKDNKPRMSCIPTGNYRVVRRYSNKYGNHFHITGVKGRSYVLIHKLNYYYNTLGCVGVGKTFSDLNKDGLKDITESDKTMKTLLAILPSEFYLQISEE